MYNPARQTRRSFLAFAAVGAASWAVGCSGSGGWGNRTGAVIGYSAAPVAAAPIAGAAGSPAAILDTPVRPSGNPTIGLGDSIMQGGSDAADNAHGPAWFNFLTVLSRQQVSFCRNAGIGGNTTAQMLARLDPDVLAHRPHAVILMGGTNDLPGNRVAAQANIAAIVQGIRAAGVNLVLCTIPPRNGAVERKAQIVAYNAWLRTFAAEQQLPLVDFFPQLANGATGDWKSGLSIDGTHPNSTGARLMAEIARAVVEPLFPAGRPYLTADPVDPANLLTNGLLQPAAGGLPTGWIQSGAADARVTVRPGDGVAGNWLQINRTRRGPHRLSQAISQRFAPGDRLAFSGLIAASDVTGAPTYGVSVQFYGGHGAVGQITPIASWSIAITQGMFYDEGLVPGGVRSATVQFTTVAPGTVRIAQVGLARVETES